MGVAGGGGGWVYASDKFVLLLFFYV